MPRRRVPANDVVANLIFQMLNGHSSRLAIDDPDDYVRRGYFGVPMWSGARLMYMGYESTAAALVTMLAATCEVLPHGPIDISIDSSKFRCPLSQIMVETTYEWKKKKIRM